MSELVQVTREGARVEIVLNRPERKNALTGAMYSSMAHALADAEADPGVLAVVFAAHGSTYCAGNDLMDFQTNPPTGAESPVLQFLHALSTSSKVVIAAVQGAAIGVGATMLLHCDYVVATEDAALHFSFVKMALVPEAASSLLLPRAVGPLKAAELMLTGEPFPVREALAAGLVSRVVPADQAIAAARAFAAKMDGAAPEALRHTKRLLRNESTSVRERMAEEGEIFRRQLASAEFTEAVRAFMEKRAPEFRRPSS
jgi:enoyl-CoA hydratase/carnithine racemase